MKKKLFWGVLLGIALTYLSVRGIPVEEVIAALRAARYKFLFLSLAFMFAVQVLRSARWGVILRPLEKIAPLAIFSITSVGFLAIVSLPARLGEFVRPYLVTRISGIRFSSALGTILLERICDSLTIVVVLAAVLLVMPLPPWVLKAGALFLVLTLAVMAAILFMSLKRDAAAKILQPLLRRLPTQFGHRLDGVMQSFIGGLTVVADVRDLISVLALSALIWLVNAGAIYSLFFAFGLHLTITAAFVLMIILIIGIAIPAAPGFIGNWHFFCILGLGLFGVPRPEALAFAIVYHFLSMAIILALGIVFLPFNRFSLADVRGQIEGGT